MWTFSQYPLPQIDTVEGFWISRLWWVSSYIYLIYSNAMKLQARHNQQRNSKWSASKCGHWPEPTSPDIHASSQCLEALYIIGTTKFVSTDSLPFVMIRTICHVKWIYPSNRPFHNWSALIWISHSKLQFDGQLMDGITSIFACTVMGSIIVFEHNTGAF